MHSKRNNPVLPSLKNKKFSGFFLQFACQEKKTL